MPDTLKQVLYWNATPTITEFDNNGGGNVSHSNFPNAATTHDANDTTVFTGQAGGDAVSLDGAGTWYIAAALDAASVSGTISFIRFKVRARAQKLFGSGGMGLHFWLPRINGTDRGSAQTPSTSFADMTLDFTTDPADGQPWTNAKINGQTWALRADVNSLDPGNFLTTCSIDISEFELQVWGPTGQVATPATHQSNLNALSGTGVANKQAPAPPTHQSNLNAVNAVGVPGLVSPATDSVRSILSAPIVRSDFSPTDGGYTNKPTDPSNVVPQRTTLDGFGLPVTVRSFKSSLGDQSTSTRDIFTSPASWPNSGTQLQPLYGAASQGLVGSAGGGNGINGVGAISGVKLHAIVRVAKKGPSSSITNVRFGTAMGVKALVTPPTIRDLSLALTEAMWEHVETALITTGQFANPFTWGNDVDSVWASFFGWTLNHTYSNTNNPGDQTQVEVAEAWVEVHGPAAPTIADENTLEQVINAGPVIIVTTSPEKV